MTTHLYERTRDHYLVSSDPSLLDHNVVNAAFGSRAMYWCNPLPAPALRTCLEHSFNLGLYIDVARLRPVGLATPPKPEQIGLARLITDYVTFAYLTDVFVVPEEQGKGLGTWLVECVGQVLGGMGYLRKAVLVTAEGRGEEYYRAKLGMERIEQGEHGVVTLQRKGPEAFTGHGEELSAK
ncbi:hypothetical protein MMC13_006515 [Lambiella insularis]|nr:hypothetical protein [Lambiella insularis]